MKISKIGSQATYHKCMTDLHNWNYFKYEPSFNPFKGSLIHMFNFQTSKKQVVKQDIKQLDTQVAEQVLYTSLNKKKHINSTNNESAESKDDLTVVSNNKAKREIFLPPSLEEVILFFQEKSKTDLEAEKFFNHFESNGWLVGGKSKMKNWQAAARNWILNSEKFNQQKNSNSASKTDRLHVNQDKQYDIPL
jgi:poly(A) polymerase Pap1